MKAFVMHEIGKVGIMDKPIPEAGPNDAVIKTTAAFVCTSDVHTVHGALGPREDRTLGHEAVGIIYKLGSAVHNLKVGDRVAVNAITPCYKCENCQRGFTSQCKGMLGGYKFTNLVEGNMAEYFHVNDAEANVVPIPESVSDEEALYTVDMMTTGFMGAEHASIPLGGTVAIFGQGPVGLMATVGARLLGAGLIITVETDPKRQELSRKYGADIVVDFKAVDAVQEIMNITGGIGVDSAIECLGAQITFENCIKVTRPGGTISNVGYHGGDAEYMLVPRLDWGVGMSDKTIRTGLCPGGRERMVRLLRLIETGRVDPKPLTTHTFKFADVEKAFQLMESKEDGIIKPMVLFD
ncbi:MAG: alcohol dehydrogenase [Peptococcaceae bacterium BRH_c4b]|nr:MAG: alcohol dehydrogenase [Peptococcaceae bacterium BRH_c4b]